MSQPSIKQLESHIRQSSLDTLNVLIMKHAKSRMKERHITLTMIYEVLQQGKLTGTPEPDARYPGIRCVMERFASGMNVAVVVYVDMPKPDLLVITVFEVQKG